MAAYELFSGTELLGRLTLERMLGGLSTRRYPLGLEPVAVADDCWRPSAAGAQRAVP